MATHSSILAWKIPWIEEPGGFQSMGLQSQKAELATPFGTPALSDRGLRLTAGRSPGQDRPLGGAGFQLTL